jgi:hypothetical protein
MDGLEFGSIINRGIFLASMTIGFFLLVIAQLLTAFIFKKNLILLPYAIYFIILSIYLMSEVFSYIYIKKKRYEYVKSPDFDRPANLSINAGVYLSCLLFVISFTLDMVLGAIIK